LRIALVVQKAIKGYGEGRVAYEVAQGALREGHQVVLIANEVAPELDSHQSACWVRIPVGRWPTHPLREQIFAWRSFRWLRRYKHQFDLVHVNGLHTWAVSDVTTAHYVHRAWLRSPFLITRLRRNFYDIYQWAYGFYHWFYQALCALMEGRAHHRAKVVVAVSEKVRRELVEIGVPPERTRTIENGVDIQEFSPGPASRRALGLPEGVPLALFVGDIKIPRKNLDTVLNALVKVPELHLAVAGDTTRSPYPRLAGQLGLAPRVHFLGYRRDVSQLMRAADVFVFPSRHESCPLVLLEAMASGLPVITASTVGMPKLVSAAGAECGIIIDNPNDSGVLAAACRRLVRDPDNLKSMGQAARAVAEQYSWQWMSEQYVQLYEEILEHTGVKGERVF